jgi:hypothetical protein
MTMKLEIVELGDVMVETKGGGGRPSDAIPPSFKKV